MIRIIFIVLTLLLSQTAYAANLFEISSTDKSVQMFLNVLFPEDLASSPLSAVLLIFNSAILMVGGILVAYTMLAGTMATAHDGEMMGKKWSSMWIPIRTAIGTAAVLPVKGGFCMAQMVVLWLALQGVGIANAIWNQYAANPADGAVIAPNANTAQLASLAQSMFKANLCVESFNKTYKADEARNPTDIHYMVGNPIPVFGTTPINEVKYSGLAYGITSKNSVITSSDKQACGLIKLGKTKAEIDSANAQIAANRAAARGKTATQNLQNQPWKSSDSKMSPSSVAQSLNSTDEAVSNAITVAHKSAMMAMNQSMSELAKAYAANSETDLVAPIDSAIDAYKTSVESAVRTAFGSGEIWNDFKENIKTDGWIMAGAWNMKLIRVQDAMSTAANKTPEFEKGTPGRLYMYKSVEPDLISAHKSLEVATTKSIHFNGLVAQVESPNSEERIIDGSKGAEAVAKLRSSIGGAIIDGLKQGDVFSLDGAAAANAQQINPLLQIKSLGASLSHAAWMILAVSAIAGGLLGGWTSIMSSWVEGMGIMTAMAMPLCIMLWVTGETMEVVIPMMPYVIWFGVVFGWFLLVIEAVFAAPLWAVAHMHPDGDGAVGRGGQGYMLILSLTLRPALMILGLVAANSILPIAGSFINSTFFGAFSIMNVESFNSPTTLLAMTGVYMGLMFTVVRKCMSLIHVIPDQILQWIGGHHSGQLGQHAESAMGGVEKVMLTQAALNQTSQVGSGARGAMAASRSAKQTRQQGEANKLSNIGNADDRSHNAIRRAAEAMGKDKNDPSSSYAVSAAKKSLASAMKDQQGIMDSNNYSAEQRENASETYNEMKQAYDALDGNFGAEEEKETNIPPPPLPRE